MSAGKTGSAVTYDDDATGNTHAAESTGFSSNARSPL